MGMPRATQSHRRLLHSPNVPSLPLCPQRGGDAKRWHPPATGTGATFPPSPATTLQLGSSPGGFYYPAADDGQLPNPITARGEPSHHGPGRGAWAGARHHPQQLPTTTETPSPPPVSSSQIWGAAPAQPQEGWPRALAPSLLPQKPGAAPCCGMLVLHRGGWHHPGVPVGAWGDGTRALNPLPTQKKAPAWGPEGPA